MEEASIGPHFAPYSVGKARGGGLAAKFSICCNTKLAKGFG